MKNYDLIQGLILRSPLLPLNTVSGKNDFSRNSLLRYYTDPLVQEALFLASPNLYAEFKRWLDNAIEDPQEVQRLENSLLKYLSRMSARCTPFGTFAGLSMAQWGKETHIDISKPKLQKKTRLDMYFVCLLSKDIVNHPDIKPLLRYYPNSSCYPLGNEVRYIETIHFASTRKYVISAVQDSEYLQLILSKAKSGARIGELIEALTSDDIEADEAKEFVEDLVKSQVLVSAIEPTLTGGDFLQQLLQSLDELKLQTESEYLTKVVTTLKQVQLRLKELDNIIGTADDYEEITSRLRELGSPTDKKYLFQVDLKKELPPATIDNKLAGSIRKAVTFLDSMSASSGSPTLDKFRQAFLERYETREVPLLLALDNESGIGFPPQSVRGDLVPLIDGIPTPAPENLNEGFFPRTKNQRVMHRKFLDALTTGAYEVNIDDSEIHVEEARKSIADSFGVMGSFLGKNEKGEDQILIKTAAGFSSAIAFMGRFTSSDDELTKYCRAITSIEEKLSSNAILAEIVHLPQARNGNILARERLREYEIPFLARSSSDEDHQIPVQDLMVSVTAGGQIFLRSKRLNKQVIPRMATAHNYSKNALPIYYFLCELQSQNFKMGVGIGWGMTNINWPFRPRLKYGNVIFSRATWVFEKEDLAFLNKKKSADLMASVKAWQEKWRIPDLIYWVEGDNELFIDLSNTAMVKLLADEIKEEAKVTLAEHIFNENALLKDGDNRGFTNEFIVSFVRRPTAPAMNGSSTSSSVKPRQLQRKFIHGSEWLFYKVYLGQRTAESFLSNEVKVLVDELMEAVLIDQWFFIRFADPGYHLRIRFHLVDLSKIGIVIGKLHAMLDPLVSDGVIFKVQTDTYDRELERYGPSSIELVEKVFHHQSNQVLHFLKFIETSTSPEAIRYLMMFTSMRQLMDYFGLDDNQKKRFLDNSLSNYEKEFRADKKTFQSLGSKYKDHSKLIALLFDDGRENNEYKTIGEEWIAIEAILQEDEIAIKELVSQINSISERVVSFEDKSMLLWSMCHMMVNRATLSNGRKHEFLLYSDVNKHFSSRLARAKHANRENTRV